jgi:hypothetical protein
MLIDDDWRIIGMFTIPLSVLLLGWFSAELIASQDAPIKTYTVRGTVLAAAAQSVIRGDLTQRNIVQLYVREPNGVTSIHNTHMHVNECVRLSSNIVDMQITIIKNWVKHSTRYTVTLLTQPCRSKMEEK